jgi:hypothetical protein
VKVRADGEVGTDGPPDAPLVAPGNPPPTAVDVVDVVEVVVDVVVGDAS